LEGKRITLKEISEQSGCDKNALSRLVNHPEIFPSTQVIDRLLQFFFDRLKPFSRGRPEAELMKELTAEFISVYPDSTEYWKYIPKHIQENPNTSNVETLWSFYEYAYVDQILLP
jgi:hypothetical protein